MKTLVSSEHKNELYDHKSDSMRSRHRYTHEMSVCVDRSWAWNTEATILESRLKYMKFRLSDKVKSIQRANEQFYWDCWTSRTSD